MDAVDYNDPMISSGEYGDTLLGSGSILTSTEMFASIRRNDSEFEE